MERLFVQAGQDPQLEGVRPDPAARQRQTDHRRRTCFSGRCVEAEVRAPRIDALVLLGEVGVRRAQSRVGFVEEVDPLRIRSGRATCDERQRQQQSRQNAPMNHLRLREG